MHEAFKWSYHIPGKTMQSLDIYATHSNAKNQLHIVQWLTNHILPKTSKLLAVIHN